MTLKTEGTRASEWVGDTFDLRPKDVEQRFIANLRRMGVLKGGNDGYDKAAPGGEKANQRLDA